MPFHILTFQMKLQKSQLSLKLVQLKRDADRLDKRVKVRIQSNPDKCTKCVSIVRAHATTQRSYAVLCSEFSCWRVLKQLIHIFCTYPRSTTIFVDCVGRTVFFFLLDCETSCIARTQTAKD
jgi:hypothetical protein